MIGYRPAFGLLGILACVICVVGSGCGSSASSGSASSAPDVTVTATINGTETTFYGYTAYDCEWVSAPNGGPYLAIYSYSGGCEFCGAEMDLYLSDSTLPTGESISCDAKHTLTYDPHETGYAAYSSLSTYGGSCSTLEVDTFTGLAGGTVSGVFNDATLAPSQAQQNTSDVTVTSGTFTCTDLSI